MKGTALHWVDGPWMGRLGLSARPRGGEWLEDEVAAWRGSGVDTVVSLLERKEERELELSDEGREVGKQGLRFRSLPIVDRDVPAARGTFVEALEQLDRELMAGRNLVVHCRQGVGRTGLVAACLLMGQGYEVERAVRVLSRARGIEMPETAAQRSWLDGYAEAFAGSQ